MLASLRRPLLVMFIKSGIAQAINIEYNSSRADKAKRLAGVAVERWPQLLPHLAETPGRYTVHQAAFHEVGLNSRCSAVIASVGA